MSACRRCGRDPALPSKLRSSTGSENVPLCEDCSAAWHHFTRNVLDDRMKHFLTSQDDRRRERAVKVAELLMQQSNQLAVEKVELEPLDAEVLGECYLNVYSELQAAKKEVVEVRRQRDAFESRAEEAEEKAEQAEKENSEHKCDGPGFDLASDVEVVVEWALEAGADPAAVRSRLSSHVTDELVCRLSLARGC